MKINLSQIKASPHPVRSTWDEEKMDELAQSIKEQGLIVPIKVRPANELTEQYAYFLSNYRPSSEQIADYCVGHFKEWEEDDDGNMWYDDEQWEIVYGHRRVEAARRAGLTEIECIVEGMEDTDALIQALIENVQREDMEPQDIYESAIALMDMKGWKNIEQLAENGILTLHKAKTIRRYGNLPDDLRPLVGKITDETRPLTMQHIDEAVAGIGRGKEDPLLRVNILRKAADEQLTAQQTRKVAESVAATKDPRMKEQLIEAPYSPYTHDPEMAKERAQRYGEHDPMAREKTPSPGVVWEATLEVKMMLDYFQSSRKMAEEAIRMDELGKFAPEARAFVARKAHQMIEAWQQVIDRLEA